MVTSLCLGSGFFGYSSGTNGQIGGEPIVLHQVVLGLPVLNQGVIFSTNSRRNGRIGCSGIRALNWSGLHGMVRHL